MCRSFQQWRSLAAPMAETIRPTRAMGAITAVGAAASSIWISWGNPIIPAFHSGVRAGPVLQFKPDRFDPGDHVDYQGQHSCRHQDRGRGQQHDLHCQRTRHEVQCEKHRSPQLVWCVRVAIHAKIRPVRWQSLPCRWNGRKTPTLVSARPSRCTDPPGAVGRVHRQESSTGPSCAP